MAILSPLPFGLLPFSSRKAVLTLNIWHSCSMIWQSSFLISRKAGETAPGETDAARTTGAYASQETPVIRQIAALSQPALFLPEPTLVMEIGHLDFYSRPRIDHRCSPPLTNRRDGCLCLSTDSTRA